MLSPQGEIGPPGPAGNDTHEQVLFNATEFQVLIFAHKPLKIK